MSDPSLSSLWDHVEELRKTLFRVFITVSLSTLFCFIFSHAFLQEFTSSFLMGEIAHFPLIFLSPFEGMEITFRFSLWMGIALSSPLCLWIVFKFASSGMHPHEKKASLPFFCCSYVFLFLGGLFAVKYLIPFATNFFYSFNEGLGKNAWTFTAYFDFVFSLIVASALSFEFGCVLFFLIHFKIISKDHLIKARKGVILSSFILGAILTPPDVFSQILMAVFFLLLYGIGILYSIIR